MALFPPANGPSGTVRAIVEWDPDGSGPTPASLVVGGDFFSVAGVASEWVARWHAGQWHAMRGGLVGGVTALATLPLTGGSREVYAVGSGLGSRVWRWDEETWSQVGDLTGVHSIIAFDADGDGAAPVELYAGGRGGVYRWDGVAWERVGAPFDFQAGAGFGPGAVHALGAHDADGPGPAPASLVAAGPFTHVNGVRTPWVAAFDGSGWSAVGDVFPDYPGSMSGGFVINSIASFDADGPSGAPARLIVAGSIAREHPSPLLGIAQWTGTDWSALGQGLLGFGQADGTALLVFDEDGAGPRLPALFVDENVATTATGGIASGIARWNGASWSAVGEGIQLGQVHALAMFDADGEGPVAPALIAGGYFQSAGGSPASNLAALAPRYCMGDVDCDRLVGFADLSITLALYGQSAIGGLADFTGDGVVDFLDLNVVLSHFGSACGK